MKHVLHIVCLAGVLAVPGAASAAQDAEYKPVSKTTETITRSPAGALVNVVRVTETKVTHTEKITETLVPVAGGQLKVKRRQTVTIDTLGNKIDVIETLRGKPPRLKPSTITTLIKGANGSSVTTVQTPTGEGNLKVSKRTVVARNADGKLVTTEETRGPDGEMTVTKQVVTD